LARTILGLENAITVDVLFPNRSTEKDSWQFAPDGITTMNGRFTNFPECTSDSVCGGQQYINDIYEMCGVNQKSVPILFDKETMTIVNNESSEIVRMFETEMKQFSSYGQKVLDLYPQSKSKQIDELNDWIYTDITNGSYKAGFSSNQDVYETAYIKYFDALSRLDKMLSSSKYLTGDDVTEADLRLFPTLYRHDPIYYSRFKLNEAYLWEYPNLWRWLGDMMNLDGMDMNDSKYLAHAKQGYFGRTGNGTIPVGPRGYPDCYKVSGWKNGSVSVLT
jgi:putative glutathione S-transferase